MTPQDAEILRVLTDALALDWTAYLVAAGSGIPRATVDKRLKHMKGEGFVEDDGKHKWRLYWATAEGRKALAAWDVEHGARVLKNAAEAIEKGRHWE